MKIHGDIASGNCLKVKYTADYLGLRLKWVAVDVIHGEQLAEAARQSMRLNCQAVGHAPVLLRAGLIQKDGP